MRLGGTVSMALAVALAAAACSGAQGGGIDAAPVVSADAAPAPDAPAPEICNGRDDNGDHQIDEGLPAELCGAVDHAMPICNGLLGCAVDTCVAGFADLDGVFANGCECAQEPGELGASACADALDLGDLPDTDSVQLVTGNLAPLGDVDTLRFRAVDTPDDSCDKFHVRVRFVDNPGDEFLVQALRGGCGGTAITAAPGVTDLRWFTNYAGGTAPPLGQCPCVPAGMPSPTVNTCVDDTAEFIVRVVRAPGAAPTCASYTLEITNGRYAPP